MTALVLVLWLQGAPSAASPTAVASPPPVAAKPEGGEEIVVLAQRPRAAVPGAILAETNLDANAVAALGASTIADVLAQITPLTDGSQARAGDAPILLVNGRRIGSFDEVKNLPPEAVERIDILPEEAALQLGYPARSKPVNIVLRRHYAAITGEAEGRLTTRGLRGDANAEMNAVRITGDNRLTLDIQYQAASAITEAKRGVIRPVDGLAISAAGILSAAGGGVLAPLAERFLGDPASGRALADFAATPPQDDTGARRTLVPASSEFTANGAFNRALGGGKTLTANARFDRLTTDELLGPAIADITIPLVAASPFSVPLTLRRSLPGLPAETRHSATNTAHLGAQIAGTGRWQWSLAGNIDSVALRQIRAGGADTTALQTAIDAGLLADPFAMPASGLVAAEPSSITTSRDLTLALNAFASTTLGRASLSLSSSAGRETIDSSDATGAHALARGHLGGQAALDVSLLAGHHGAGALNAGANASADRWSDAGSALGYGGTLLWKPRKTTSLLLSAARDAAPATMAQRGAAADVSPAASFYDYTTGTPVIAAQTTGGNPALTTDSRTVLKAELGLRPLAGLTLTTTFTSLIDRNPVFAFPGITPAVAAALPGRITRDAQGDVIAVDARAFNAAREARQELRLSAVFTRNFGPSGPRVPGAGSFGGGRSFAAQGNMIQASLTDTLRLTDRLALASGAPSLDLVGGNALGDALRVPRHRVEGQFSGVRNGLGLRASAVWTSGGAAGAGTPGALRFDDHLALNMRLFWFPAKTAHLGEARPWLKGVRLLLAVDNLLDSWQRVYGPGGLTPLTYQRGIVDPIGRTIRFSIRKTID